MKYIYNFTEGNENMRNLLGIKGARLSELANLNLPIPKGFIISTAGSKCYYEREYRLTEDLEQQIFHNLGNLERNTGKVLNNNLLLSVRSSAITSMPGLGDAVLNLGMNDEVYRRLVRETKNERFATELYINFIITFMYLVLEEDHIVEFENINHDIIAGYFGNGYENILTERMIEAISASKEIYNYSFKASFPEDPKKQLLVVIKAMYKSWNSKKNKVYRRLNEMDDTLNMGIVIQEMVYGNRGRNSVIGHVFSREFITGKNIIYPLFTTSSQRNKHYRYDSAINYISELNKVSPECISEITTICKTVETKYKDMQRIDFVVENNKPYVLMSEKGNREAEASLNIAADLVKEGIIDEKEAINRITPKELKEITLPIFDKSQIGFDKIISKGIGTSKGVTSAKVYFDFGRAYECKLQGDKVILITPYIIGNDNGIEAINLVDGVVTTGGPCSVGSVIARECWKPCVSLNWKDITINKDKTFCIINGVEINEGDYLSIDGTEGNIYKGRINIVQRELEGNYGLLHGYGLWVTETINRNEY